MINDYTPISNIIKYNVCEFTQTCTCFFISQFCTLFPMLVLVRGDPAFTKTEVIGLDILAPRQPKLYGQVVNGLGYSVNPSTNIGKVLFSFIFLFFLVFFLINTFEKVLKKLNSRKIERFFANISRILYF